MLTGIPFVYRLSGDEAPPSGAGDSVTATLDGVTFFAGLAAELSTKGVAVSASKSGRHEIVVARGTSSRAVAVRAIPGALSILPPLVAIAFALIFRQVVIALLAGIWLGNLFLTGFHPLESLLRIVDHDVVVALSGQGQGADHASIIVFTLLLGGMVGIMYRMGGMQGIVDQVSKLATTPRRGQLAAWLMGVIIFFDDYANTLIVGNSMRPLTDRVRVSREKLSYIVDSTAAPVTAIAVITSWIGFQISLIDQSFDSLGIDRNPFTAYLASIPYCYYCVFAVLFVLAIALTGRDYGPMLTAERRARTTGKATRDGAVLMSNIDSENAAAAPGTKPRIVNGILPIAVVLAVAFAGLVVTGRQSLAAAGRSGGILDAMKESNSFTALLWCSMAGCLAAGLLALGERLLSLTDTLAAWLSGIRSMMLAIVILVLAWCIGMKCEELRTADYLVHSLSGVLAPRFIPLLVFLIAMGISFSTGTSWGTMSILTPIVIPLVFGAARNAGVAGGEFETILSASIAAILSGAVFGDHCSPISDTTIMSSMASSSDHIDHVRTQLPYAATAAAVAFVFGYLPVAFGVPGIYALLLGAAAVFGVVRRFGKHPEVA